MTQRIDVVDDGDVTTVPQKYIRSAQDEILPVNYDSAAIDFSVPRPIIRSLNEQAQTEYEEFLRTLYQRDTASSTTGRMRRNAAVDKKSENMIRKQRAIIFRPLFDYKAQEFRLKKIKKEKPKQISQPKPSAAQIYQQAVMTGQRQQFQG